MSEDNDQSFVCQRCKVQIKPEPNKPDSFGHFTKDAEVAYTQTAETSPRNTMSSMTHLAFDPIHPLVGTATLDSNPSMKQAAEITLKIVQNVQVCTSGSCDHPLTI